jgi:acetyltransferase-like isoleucine patch superfamily enzyme
MPPQTSPAPPGVLSDPDLIEAAWLARLYDVLGRRADPRLIAWLGRRYEGGEFQSRTLRRLLWDRYGIAAGAWSYGAFHRPLASEPGVTIGRFASISRDVRWGLGHPMDHVALSHVFADPAFGFTQAWPFERPTLEIGADAWVGAQVVITSGCRRIGIGAAVGAGSVVTRDVPDFAVVFGAPARVVRSRFGEDVQAEILASRWWERPLAELRRHPEAFTGGVAEAAVRRALGEFSHRERA